MDDSNKPFCAGQHGRFCYRPPTMIVGGLHYCWQHNPDYIQSQGKAKREKRRAEFEAAEAKADARIARKKLELAAGLLDLADADLKAIAAFGGVKKLLAIAASLPSAQEAKKPNDSSPLCESSAKNFETDKP